MTKQSFFKLVAILFLLSSAFSQVAPLNLPRIQFVDHNGNPLAGGKVYSYQAGTSTPLATYVDSAGVIQNSNPVILDSAGAAVIWVGSSLYKFIVQDSSGVQQFTLDNVSSYNSLLTGVNANITGIFTSSTSNPATTGALRLAASDCIYIRNAANSLDLQMLCKDSSDRIVLGDTTGGKIPAWLDFAGQNPAPAVSNAGEGRTYYDSTRKQQMWSENAGGYYSRGVILYATGTAGSAIASTTSETVAYTADTTHIPANTFTTVGQILRATYGCKFSTTATPNLQTRLRLDSLAGTVIGDFGTLTTQNNASNHGCMDSAVCVVTAVGAGGSMNCSTMGSITGSATTSPSTVPAPTTVAFDTTVAHDVVPTEQWSASSASNTVTGQLLVIEKPN